MKRFCVSTAATLRALAIGTAFLSPVSVCAATLTVSNNSDLVNGNVGSPSALIANPGADGISLREAVRAVHGAPGPHTITFAPSLAGATIALTGGLSLLQDNVALVGLFGSDRSPAITIDANALTANNGPIVLEIRASNVSVSHIRFVNIRQVFTISVRAGQLGVAAGVFPQRVDHIEITDNEFDNSVFPNSHCNAISIGMDAPASNADLGNATIARNVFANFTGEADGIHIPTGGENNTIHDVVISENRFSNITFPVELVHAGPSSNSRISGVRILSNTFVGNAQAVSIGAIGNDGKPAARNVIDGTEIAGNIFESNRVAVSTSGGAVQNAISNTVTNTIITNNTFTATGGQAVLIAGAMGSDGQANSTGNVVDGTWITHNTFSGNVGPGISLTGGVANATENAVTNTTISNNLIHGTTTFGGIAIVAARTGGRLNRIDGVTIINNTIVGNVGGGIVVNDDPNRTGGNNTHSGISAGNSIVVGNTSSFDKSTQDFAGLTPEQVTSSLTDQPGFDRGGGNLSGDPRFVNAPLGDYHLQAGSPAIDAGNSSGAPATDLEGNRRFDELGAPNRGAGPIAYYDIGAFEFGSAPAAPPAVTVEALGPITNRTLGITVTPPASVLDQSGSVFVWLSLPMAQGSRAFALNANGGWISDLKCESPADAYSGRLREGLTLSLVSEGTDLSRLQGAVIYVGYGLGSTATAACTDMLTYATFKAVYTID